MRPEEARQMMQSIGASSTPPEISSRCLELCQLWQATVEALGDFRLLVNDPVILSLRPSEMNLPATAFSTTNTSGLKPYSAKPSFSPPQSSV
ncbi:hypothetical protein HZ326_3123 [Fusarium oxysporum f. sp. albedinis]|nr:hypothetical protein HZ326_3123 [Fusarium oxysporum f. sp. albedinis]